MEKGKGEFAPIHGSSEKLDACALRHALLVFYQCRQQEHLAVAQTAAATQSHHVAGHRLAYK